MWMLDTNLTAKQQCAQHTVLCSLCYLNVSCCTLFKTCRKTSTNDVQVCTFVSFSVSSFHWMFGCVWDPTAAVGSTWCLCLGSSWNKTQQLFRLHNTAVQTMNVCTIATKYVESWWQETRSINTDVSPSFACSIRYTEVVFFTGDLHQTPTVKQA